MKYSKTCPYCGIDNFRDAQFCRNCGQQLPNPDNYFITKSSLLFKQKWPLGLALMLIICGMICVTYLFKKNDRVNIVASQYQPYELQLFDQRGSEVDKVYLTFKITKKKENVYHGKVIFLTQSQASNATGPNISKYFQRNTNYAMVFDSNKYQLRLQMPTGQIILKDFYGAKKTTNERVVEKKQNYHKYTLRMLETSP
ncbi:zinc ribbon domain-containing protein [Limosilactobacillus caviae]|uniref:zinc ribbon domain-containing protein n=1 Tax=Limosilactobacillus caviae TaxID=1769424 RepID=UPI00129B0114|nr:zinc ribbon domain-containing protein [Limosilactobacillus caviae]MCD7123243.1 zinc ribbon domain-containing protein [Limosilactobacillus caviae]MRH46711.1 hypothetical protein [Limosilactobacillus reuteri]